jgi:hypothetical protein
MEIALGIGAVPGMNYITLNLLTLFYGKFTKEISRLSMRVVDRIPSALRIGPLWMLHAKLDGRATVVPSANVNAIGMPK